MKTRSLLELFTRAWLPITRYFRSGHISMTPTLRTAELIRALVQPSSNPEQSARQFPDTHNTETTSLTFNGSAALYRAAQHLQLSTTDTVLLPAYGCGAEIGPFEYAGCRLSFYDNADGLNVDVEQISQILESDESVKALLVTHHFGLAQAKVTALKQLCEKTGTLLIEDCAHALYCEHENTMLGSIGHLAIFSPRKTLPLTEGGIFVVNNTTGDVTIPSQVTAQESVKPERLALLQRLCYSIQQGYRSRDNSLGYALIRGSGIALWAIPSTFIKLIKRAGLTKKAHWLTADAEGSEAIPIYRTRMSSLMHSVYRTTNKSNVIERRRHNFYQLLSSVQTQKSDTIATPVISELPEGFLPLYFPIFTPNPAELVAYLEGVDIEAFNWWQHLHPTVNWTDFPVARRLKQSIVALPVHQQLTSRQIERIASALTAYETETHQLNV